MNTSTEYHNCDLSVGRRQQVIATMLIFSTTAKSWVQFNFLGHFSLFFHALACRTIVLSYVHGQRYWSRPGVLLYIQTDASAFPCSYVLKPVTQKSIKLSHLGHLNSLIAPLEGEEAS